MGSYSGSAFECYTSNNQNKKWNDDGVMYPCRLEAGATKRHCVKFTRGKTFHYIFKPK